jgi:hypothetical protein
VTPLRPPVTPESKSRNVGVAGTPMTARAMALARAPASASASGGEKPLSERAPKMPSDAPLDHSTEEGQWESGSPQKRRPRVPYVARFLSASVSPLTR